MKIDKDEVLSHLRGMGKNDEAEKAQHELPDQLDTDDEAHKSMLSKFGADIGGLKNKLGGLGSKI